MRSLRARVALLLGLLPLAAGICGFGPPTLIESESAGIPVTPSVVKAMDADRVPGLSARTAVLMDDSTGQFLYEKNSHARRAQASLTKMMTALVTLDRAKLDEIVTASPNVLVEPTIIGLEPGDKLTVEQMLYGLMLESGNDAAIALAEHVGGSIPRFAELMNARVAVMGLKDTHFVTPNGLDAPEHYSSAYDLALTARAGLKNPVFARIVSSKDFNIAGPPRWRFTNSNQLLASYSGAVGVKTGYTDDAGRCLAFSATRNGHRMISVVMDAGTMYEDSAALADYYFANFSWETLSFPAIPLRDGVSGTPSRAAEAKSRPEIVFPSWQRPYLRWNYLPSATSSQDGSASGTAVYTLFGKKVAEVELYQGVN